MRCGALHAAAASAQPARLLRVVANLNNAAGGLIILPSGRVKGFDSSKPTAVPGLARVRDVAAGAGFDLTLLDDGTVRAWGYNGYCSMGLGHTTEERDRAERIPLETGKRSGTSEVSREGPAIALAGP